MIDRNHNPALVIALTDAAELLRKVVRNAVDLPASDVDRLGHAMLALSRALDELGADDERRQVLQYVVDGSADTSMAEAALLLGAQLAEEGDHDAARALFEAAAKSHDDDLATAAEVRRFEAMQALYGDDELDWSTLERLERERSSSPIGPWVQLAKGRALQRRGDHDGAARALRRATADEGSDVALLAWHELGRLALSRGDHAGAIVACSRAAMADEPLGSDARLLLAEALDASGQPELAAAEAMGVVRLGDVAQQATAQALLEHLRDRAADQRSAAAAPARRDATPSPAEPLGRPTSTAAQPAPREDGDDEAGAPPPGPSAAPTGSDAATSAEPGPAGFDDDLLDGETALPRTVAAEGPVGAGLSDPEATDWAPVGPSPTTATVPLGSESADPAEVASLPDERTAAPVPDRLRSLFDEAHALIDGQGDLDRAASLMEEVAREGHPAISPLAAFYLGWIAEARGDVEAAAATYESTMSSSLKDAAALSAYHLGLLRAAAGDHAAARRAYEAAIAAEDPAAPRVASLAAVNLGAILADLGELEEALEVYKFAAASPDPDASIRGWWGQAVVHLEAGSELDARLALTRVMTSGHADLSSAAALRLGLLLKEAGHVDDARSMYQWAMESGHPDHGPKAAFNLGLMLEEVHDLDGARAAFEEVVRSGHVEAAPRAQDILDELDAEDAPPAPLPDEGELTATIRSAPLPTRATGTEDEQIEHYQRQITYGLPDDAATAAFNLAVLQEARGEHENAKASYQKAIASGVREVVPRAHLNLGALLESIGDRNGARMAYRGAFQSGLVDFAQQATFNLALMKERQGDAEGARRAFRHVVISRHPDMAPRAAFNLGLMEHAAGNEAEARKAFEFVVESGHETAAPHARRRLDEM